MHAWHCGLSRWRLDPGQIPLQQGNRQDDWMKVATWHSWYALAMVAALAASRRGSGVTS